MHGVRQAAPSEVLASAPGGSDSIVSETFAPLERLLGMKSQLGVQELQPAASRALATAHTRTKGVIAVTSPRPRARRTIRGVVRLCNQSPAAQAPCRFGKRPQTVAFSQFIGGA